MISTSVPDPDPSDPHVFGAPGSGSTSQRYGSGSDSGSGPFYHHAKIVRKTLIPAILWLFLIFLSLKNDVNVPSKSNKQKKIALKISFLLASWRLITKIAGAGSISQKHGSEDPDWDPPQNVMDPEHWFLQWLLSDMLSLNRLMLMYNVRIVPRNEQKKLLKKLFGWHLESHCQNSRIRICNLEYGSKYPNRYKNVRDPVTLP